MGIWSVISNTWRAVTWKRNSAESVYAGEEHSWKSQEAVAGLYGMTNFLRSVGFQYLYWKQKSLSIIMRLTTKSKVSVIGRFLAGAKWPFILDSESCVLRSRQENRTWGTGIWDAFQKIRVKPHGKIMEHFLRSRVGGQHPQSWHPPRLDSENYWDFRLEISS